MKRVSRIFSPRKEDVVADGLIVSSPNVLRIESWVSFLDEPLLILVSSSLPSPSPSPDSGPSQDITSTLPLIGDYDVVHTS